MSTGPLIPIPPKCQQSVSPVGVRRPPCQLAKNWRFKIVPENQTVRMEMNHRLVALLERIAAPSVPDFSGMWAHPSLPGFEPLASGPTSLTNRSRRPDGVSNVLVLAGDYANPILKPEAAATVKKFGEMSLNHFGFHNPRNQC